jgi:hypothetical protein
MPSQATTLAYLMIYANEEKSLSASRGPSGSRMRAAIRSGRGTAWRAGILRIAEVFRVSPAARHLPVSELG